MKEALHLGCREEILPISYLGMPLGDNPKKISFRDRVMDKIRNKLVKWRGFPISKGGRLTLAILFSQASPSISFSPTEFLQKSALPSTRSLRISFGKGPTGKVETT